MARWRLVAWGLASLLLALGLDLWTKEWAWNHLRPMGTKVALWPPILELDFTLNRGSAFGIVREIDQTWIFLPITVFMLGFLLFATLTNPGIDRLRVVGLGIVYGGALGNLHDRFFRADWLGRHGVVDFIAIHYPWGGSWPTFNVADAALLIGTGMLMWSLSRAPASYVRVVAR